MQIEYKKLTEITPYWNNPRKNDDAVEFVANSIKEFGFKVPIIIDRDGIIVAGHTRYKAARKLKLKEVPVICADDLTEEQVKAFRLADNKVGELAEWDFDQLEIELDKLIDFGMSDFGFEFDLDDTDDLEPIDDEENGGTLKYDHILKIDKKEIPMTNEEYENFNDLLEQYLDETGVTIGFINHILEKIYD